MPTVWLWLAIAFVPVGIGSFCIIASRIDRRHTTERRAKNLPSPEEVKLEKLALGQLLCLRSCGCLKTTTATMRKMIKEGALELPCYITRRMRREQNLDEIIAEITNATVARKIKQTT